MSNITDDEWNAVPVGNRECQGYVLGNLGKRLARRSIMLVYAAHQCALGYRTVWGYGLQSDAKRGDCI